jgi:hypothetical protein
MFSIKRSPFSFAFHSLTHIATAMPDGPVIISRDFNSLLERSMANAGELPNFEQQTIGQV